MQTAGVWNSKRTGGSMPTLKYEETPMHTVWEYMMVEGIPRSFLTYFEEGADAHMFARRMKDKGGRFAVHITDPARRNTVELRENGWSRVRV